MKDTIRTITSKLISLQDETGCWHVMDEKDKNFPMLNYYMPIYKSTLWTLILLADLKTDIEENDFKKPLSIISNHFYDKAVGIYTIGKSHYPIPCLNGNMIYLHSYFNYEKDSIVEDIIDFFVKYQRFDDGDFKTPSTFPYYSNKSCYGKHTCYWGVVKLLKGLSFIPVDNRSKNADILIKRCIDFILLHDVCFSSHNKTEFIHTNIKKLTFPNMYQGDFLEILWLLKRENVNSVHLKRALDLLTSKMNPDLTWKIERQIKNIIIPINNKNIGKECITDRAKDVIDYYQSTNI